MSPPQITLVVGQFVVGLWVGQSLYQNTPRMFMVAGHHFLIMKEKAICLREIPQITKNTALDMAVHVKITSSSFDWSVRKASQFEGSCICQDNAIYLK